MKPCNYIIKRVPYQIYVPFYKWVVIALIVYKFDLNNFYSLFVMYVFIANM